MKLPSSNTEASIKILSLLQLTPCTFFSTILILIFMVSFPSITVNPTPQFGKIDEV